jgi:hypothetical protein
MVEAYGSYEPVFLSPLNVLGYVCPFIVRNGLQCNSPE